MVDILLAHHIFHFSIYRLGSEIDWEHRELPLWWYDVSWLGDYNWNKYFTEYLRHEKSLFVDPPSKYVDDVILMFNRSCIDSLWNQVIFYDTHIWRRVDHGMAHFKKKSPFGIRIMRVVVRTNSSVIYLRLLLMTWSQRLSTQNNILYKIIVYILSN